MSRFAISLLALLLICYSTHAQQYVDILRTDYDQGQSTDFKDTNGTGHYNELAVDLLVPLIFPVINNSKAPILTGFLLERTHASLNPNQEVNLYGLMLKLGVNIKHSERLSGTYLMLPKLSSDLVRIRRRDVQIGGLVFLKYERSKTFNYRFGFYANSDLYAPMIVPIFGIYALKGNWEITSALPINAQITRSLGKRFGLGLRFEGINKSYILNDGTNRYVEKVNNELGVLLKLALNNIHLRVLGGYSIGRSFRTYDMNDRFPLAISAIKIANERTILNADFRDGAFLRTSLTYRLPIP